MHHLHGDKYCKDLSKPVEMVVTQSKLNMFDNLGSMMSFLSAIQPRIQETFPFLIPTSYTSLLNACVTEHCDK